MFKNRKRFRKHTLLENNKNKIKRKRGKLRKQIESHINAEYKFILKNDLEDDVN